MTVKESVVRDMIHNVQQEIFSSFTKFAIEKKHDLKQAIEAVAQCKRDVEYQEKRLADFEKSLMIEELQQSFYDSYGCVHIGDIDYCTFFSALHDFSKDEIEVVMDKVHEHGLDTFFNYLTIPDLNKIIVNYIREQISK